MATLPKSSPQSQAKLPAESPLFITKPAATKEPEQLVFNNLNYTLMLASIGIIFLGYIIMCMETATYGFGFLGLTLGPIISLLGFILAVVSILYRKTNGTTPESN